MNILFICSANKDRSKTAEDYFSEKHPEIHFDSAGTNKKTCNQLGANYIEEHQIHWADRIYVMEIKHLEAIKRLYNYSKKITVLNIKDHYKYYDPDLVQILKERIKF